MEGSMSLNTEADTTAALQHYADLLTGSGAPLEIYREASDALIAALDHLSSPVGLDPACKDALYRSLILQPVNGIHQLGLQFCRLATSGLPETAGALVGQMRQTLFHLVGELESLTAEEKCRVVLFAVTTRAFSESWLAPETLSSLHKSCFSRFSHDDLALPYSVIFNPEIFAQNRQDLINRFLPQGYLEATHELSLNHVLLLAWLSGEDIFAGQVSLSDFIQLADLFDEHEAAAARSLILRFGARETAADTTLKKRLGLTDLPVAESPRHRDLGKTRLENKTYQVLNAGLTRVKTALPFLAPFQRKPKIGICLSGQLRGYETALATWKARLLPLIEAHVFIHSWYDIGRSGAQPFRKVLPFEGEAFTAAYREIAVALGFEEMQKRYPTLFTRLAEGGRVSEDSLSETYGTEQVVLEDDKASPFSDFSNQQKMHYKIHAADALARSAGDFDLLMRIRPDLSLREIGFSWRDLLAVAQSSPVLFAEKGYGVHYGGLLIGDQFAIAAPEIMQTYADTWLSFPKLATMGFAKMPAHFTGHVSLAQTCWLNGIDVVRAPIRFGELNEARRLPLADSIAAIEADSTGTSEDLKLLAASKASL